jgi:hypothetical protein
MKNIPEKRIVPEYPTVTVDSDGNVYRTETGELLKSHASGKGYLYVTVRPTHGVPVHRLVCLAFHGPKGSSRNQVRHLDGNKLNNAASNLKWGTPVEDTDDRRRHGTILRGERHGNCRLKSHQVVPPKKRTPELVQFDTLDPWNRAVMCGVLIGWKCRDGGLDWKATTNLALVELLSTNTTPNTPTL